MPGEEALPWRYLSRSRLITGVSSRMPETLVYFMVCCVRSHDVYNARACFFSSRRALNAVRTTVLKGQAESAYEEFLHATAAPTDRATSIKRCGALVACDRVAARNPRCTQRLLEANHALLCEALALLPSFALLFCVGREILQTLKSVGTRGTAAPLCVLWVLI